MHPEIHTNAGRWHDMNGRKLGYAMKKKRLFEVFGGIAILLTCAICSIIWRILFEGSPTDLAVCGVLTGLLTAVVSVSLYEMVLGDKKKS